MRTRSLALGAAGLVLAGCGGSAPSAPEPKAAARTVVVTSPAFADGATIPAAYTCAGAGTSPEVDWAGVPDDARALALVVDDPDAPHGTFIHWVVVDIPVLSTRAPRGAPPSGGTELRGSAGPGWSPPCPPAGTHHYRFSVYALRSRLGLPGDASLDDAMSAIEDATAAWGRITGTVRAGG